MSVRVLHDQGEHVAALYDSVTGIAFGQTFESPDEAEQFLAWLEPADARELMPAELEEKRRQFERVREQEASL